MVNMALHRAAQHIFEYHRLVNPKQRHAIWSFFQWEANEPIRAESNTSTLIHREMLKIERNCQGIVGMIKNAGGNVNPCTAR
jgi:hypothetical protein